MDDFHTFADYMQDAISELGKHLGPNDDWLPVLHIVNDKSEVFIIALDPAFFSSAEAKNDAVNRVIAPRIISTRARMISFVATVWMVSREDINLDDPPRPSESPDRIECVVLSLIDRDRARAYVAQIKRDGSTNPPTLGEWEEYGAGANSGITGRFVEPVQEALRRVPVA